MPGLKLSVLYGFWPHRLGFCGPRKKLATRTLLNYLSGKKVSKKKVREILKEFKGAYTYYKLIAKHNKIKDPFDEKVVKAYWIGNKLLSKVPVDSLKEVIIKEFSGAGFLPLKLAKEKAREIPAVSKPHHSFHVLVIGSVTDRINLQGKLLDFCRVSWGRVKKIKKKNLVVEYQPLVKKRKFQLARLIEKEVAWEKDFLPQLKAGNWVSIHWNHVVQILNKKDLANLKKYTQITIDSLNE
jgi:hypothetical protein